MYDTILRSQWRNVKILSYIRDWKVYEVIMTSFLTKTLQILHDDIL